jgi:hypothetical protein
MPESVVKLLKKVFERFLRVEVVTVNARVRKHYVKHKLALSLSLSLTHTHTHTHIYIFMHANMCEYILLIYWESWER